MSNAKIGTCGACNFRINGKCSIPESVYNTVGEDFTGCNGYWYEDTNLGRLIIAEPSVTTLNEMNDFGESYHWYNNVLYAVSYDGTLREAKTKCDILISTGFGNTIKVHNMDR